MITPEFISQCILQHTEQEAVDWFIDDEHGGYFAIIDGWVVRLKGSDKFIHLSYQKGPKFGHIIIQPRGFFGNDDSELKNILKQLLKKVRERIFPDGDEETIKILEKQEQKIRKEFCASMLGWDKKT